MSESKYHHLIPKTYLKSWCFSGMSVYSFNKAELSKPVVKNLKNNFGENNYHSIKAGMPCCTEEDLIKIFEPLKNTKVVLDGKELESLYEYNRYYYDFENWELFYPENVRVPKAEVNKINDNIENNKVLDIEKLWNVKYENGWNSLLQFIEQKLKGTADQEIDEFYKGKLMKFIVSLNWRSFISNESLRESFSFINTLVDLKDIEIPFDERNVKRNKTASDEMKHNYLLKLFRSFLNDEGLMYDIAKGYIKNLTLRLLISSGDIQFITSDNPSFLYKENDRIHHIMPVTPQILISVEKDSLHRGKYCVEHIPDDEVERFNLIIINNADEFVISRNASVH
ncbi:DUF4238 domain-containing protein [Desulfitobacterium hafniense]|uniref:DUF4238 domain-containing protein n=1 Tax=Desulfitobacterium hafniense (strain Y51) TaxID=138119 RepID=Q24NM4_DESHY|nr:DUF4238 domain-containing protein [Desulfitobacterium hafniense]BAE86368.1 hypothetical protein DSY4579 [Desulfitobacterium hafniense Y51]